MPRCKPVTCTGNPQPYLFSVRCVRKQIVKRKRSPSFSVNSVPYGNPLRGGVAGNYGIGADRQPKTRKKRGRRENAATVARPRPARAAFQLPGTCSRGAVRFSRSAKVFSFISPSFDIPSLSADINSESPGPIVASSSCIDHRHIPSKKLRRGALTKRQ
jgi:hypothetical protein